MANKKNELDIADQLLQKQTLLKDREQVRKETIEDIDLITIDEFNELAKRFEDESIYS